jgi:hypothetical protein
MLLVVDLAHLHLASADPRTRLGLPPLRSRHRLGSPDNLPHRRGRRSHARSAPTGARSASLAHRRADRTPPQRASARPKLSASDNTNPHTRIHHRAQSHLQIPLSNASPITRTRHIRRDRPRSFRITTSGPHVVCGAVPRTTFRSSSGRSTCGGFWRINPIACGGQSQQTAADMRISDGQGRDRTGDLPLLRWK